MRNRAWKMLAMLSLAAVLVSCKKDSAPETAGGETAGGETTAGETAAGETAAGETAAGQTAAKPAAAAPAPVNPEMATAVRQVATALAAKKCSETSTSNCPGYAEAAKLLDTAGKELDAVQTLAALINDQDAAVRHVAGFLFYGSARQRAFAQHADAITPALAEQLVAGLARLQGYAAARAAKVAAWAASMTSKLDALSKAIEGHPNSSVAELALTQLMTFGRLAAFDKVQHYAKSAKPTWIVAALKAPREMPKWTDDERAKICPWGMGFLSNADLAQATEAGHLMNRCKHESKYVEALLAEGKKRVDAGEWKIPYDFPFRDICFGGFFGTDKKASQELCDKTYGFLQSIADNDKVEAKMRARALSWIVYQRRDQKSLALLKRYRKHKLPEVAKAAADGIAMLERSLGAKR